MMPSTKLQGKADIFLIDCSKPHAYYVDQECEFYYFHFAGRAAYEITKDLISNNGCCLFHIVNADMIRTQMKQTISPLFYEQPVSGRIAFLYGLSVSLYVTGSQ